MAASPLAVLSAHAALFSHAGLIALQKRHVVLPDAEWVNDPLLFRRAQCGFRCLDLVVVQRDLQQVAVGCRNGQKPYSFASFRHSSIQPSEIKRAETEIDMSSYIQGKCSYPLLINRIGLFQIARDQTVIERLHQKNRAGPVSRSRSSKALVSAAGPQCFPRN